MVASIALLCAFLAIVLAVQTLATAVLEHNDRTRRVNRRLTLLEKGLSTDEVYAALVQKPRSGRLTIGADTLMERFYLYCRQAGLGVTPQRLALYVSLAALAIWGLALAGMATFGRLSGGNAVISLVGAAMLSALGAYAWIARRHTVRLRQLELQLPNALDIVIRALRAGYPVISAVQLAASEMSDPIGSEFGLIVDETMYGLDFQEALKNFAYRTGSAEAHYFAVSVGIQAETGGNLAEVLSGLAEVIRGRQTLRLRVKALASEGMVSAQLLSGLPILLVAWLMLTQPDFYSSKFNDPIFWPAVFVVLLTYMLGIFWIRRIINFKY